MSEASLDVELRQMLANADSQREAEDGVNATLLLAAQAEMEDLAAKCSGLQMQVQASLACVYWLTC